MAAKSDEVANKNGRLWALDQQFDQPMDVEADCIKPQNDESVSHISKASFFLLIDNGLC